jgi:hypothetical protein
VDSPDNSASTDVSVICGQTMGEDIKVWIFMGKVWNKADPMLFCGF